MTSKHKHKGLVKITGESDLFYDSIEKVYRYRSHCPNCRKVSGCRCYQELDSVLCDILDDIADVYCSAKCCLLIGDWDELEEARLEANISRKDVNRWTKKECNKVLEILTDNADFDMPSGETCET